MFTLLKNFFTLLILSSSINLWSDENPYNFIDSNAQKMVIVLKENKSLFLEDRQLYEEKIKEIFEPMIDFRRVAATVMGKYYLASSKEQRAEFVVIFKDSLLDTYAETLAQWENQTITTIFPKNMEIQTNNLKYVEVQQTLNTGSSKYPISYKLRKNKDNSWSIVNIIVNGVNLGLTFRNQFQALAIKNNGNIESTLNGWVSDAGDAGISG